MKLHFTDPNEFIDELAKRPPADGVVRLTTRKIAHPYQLAVYELYVVASYFFQTGAVGILTRLECDCGQLIGTMPVTVKTQDRAAEVTCLLTKAITDAGYTVEGGVYQEEVAHR